jgi:hypothetical protein
MLASSLFYLLGCALLSAVLCTIGVLLTYFLQGEATALGLMNAWVVEFNGILVGATGYGLLLFVRAKGRAILAQLNNLLEVSPEHAAKLLKLHHRTISWFWTNLVSIPITVVGAIILWNCRFPLIGFAHIYLAICAISIYYVASSILAFFVYTLALFSYIEDQSQRGLAKRLTKKRQAGMDLTTIDSFFVIASTIGVASIYLGFRGTLTANFVNTPAVFKSLLILPTILYLPATLCFSFYPRYVLRKIAECDVLCKIQEFEDDAEKLQPSNFKDGLELKKLILELKEKMVNEYNATPLLGIKDAPSLTISILLVLQFIFQKDSVVANFFHHLFN